MQSLARPAPRPGKVTTEDPHYVHTSASPAHAASSAPAQQEKKRGRPAKQLSCIPSRKQHTKAAGGQPVDQHVCQISTDFVFGAFICARFELALGLGLAHS